MKLEKDMHVCTSECGCMGRESVWMSQRSLAGKNLGREGGGYTLGKKKQSVILRVRTILCTRVYTFSVYNIFLLLKLVGKLELLNLPVHKDSQELSL